MQDNFNIHNWRLNQAINEDKSLQVNITDDDWSQSIAYKISDALIKAGYSRDMIKQVAKAILTRPSLQEVEEATFTDKFDDNPKLKGGQKKLPDELQAQIVKKEGEVGEDFNKNVEDFIAKHINIIKDAVKFYKNQDESYEDSLIQTIYNFFERYASEDWENLTMDWPDEKDEIFYNALKSVLSKKNINEDSEDHEVAMAKSSLQSIMSSASKLMMMLGDEERNIPGWIQDHITNAENYIDQAAQGFHELENNNEED